MRIRTLLAAAAALMALVVPRGAGATQVRGQFERRCTVGPAADLRVNTGSGDIDVHAGPPGVIRVVGRVQVERTFWHARGDAERRLAEILAHPPVDQSGNRVEIGRREPHDLFDNVSIDYYIEAPPDARVTAHTGSGDVRANGLHGPLEVSTGSGDVKVWDAPSGARLFTGSGDVEVHSLAGDLQARTGSGDVLASGTPTGAWDVHTGSGSVTLRMPAGARFELDAHSGSGDIVCDHPFTTVTRLGHSTLHGLVNSGGPKVTVRTGSGDITLQ